MQLGINGWRIQGQRTGVGRYLLNIVRHWTPDNAAAFSRITFYVPKPIDRASLGLPDNVDVAVVPPDSPMLVWENLRLGPTTRDDVLFCPSYSRPIATRATTVVTTHDAVQQIHPELFPAAVRLFYNPLYRWSARHAAIVVTDSEGARQDIARLWQVPLGRIRVVYLAPADVFRPSSDAARVADAHRRAVGSDAPFFLFVGKISGRRNLPCLLEAFALFRKRTGQPHRLLLVGLNPHQLDVDAITTRLGVAEHVRRCGYVTDEELNLLYNGAVALVMPSVYETVSLPVMEAQAAGAPVVCIDTAGMREITGGAAAMIPTLAPEPLSDAMVRVAEDAAFRADIARRGLAHAKQFSWTRCARETIAVLAEAGGAG